jgi:hypothetical protein
MTRSSVQSLQFDPEQNNQIYPKHTHKVPVTRGGNQGVTAQSRLTQPAQAIEQSTQTTQHVQSMDSCQHIEKGTAWIRG